MLGLISATLVTLLVVAVHSILSFDLSSFSLFFIVPVGAMLTGTVACYGYYRGLLKSDRKLDSRLKWLGAVLALLTFAAVQYGFYHTAYLDEDMNLNFAMTGEHISQYCYTGEEKPINFFSFTKRMIESRRISFSKYGNTMLEVDGNSVVNWVFFGIDLLGAMSGSLVAQGFVIGSRKYCDQCMRYMKQKDLFNFSASDLGTLEQLKNINSLAADEIRALLATPFDGKGAYYDVHLDWCAECFDGYLELKLMQPDRKGRMQHNQEQSVEIRLSSARRFLDV